MFYRSPSGEPPVQKFIDSLELLVQSKVYNSLELLKEFNIKLGIPHVKKITNTDLWELRILGTDNIRLLYIAIIGKTLLLLHAFKKKKQKTSQKEIKTALERLTEYRKRIK